MNNVYDLHNHAFGASAMHVADEYNNYKYSSSQSYRKIITDAVVYSLPVVIQLKVSHLVCTSLRPYTCFELSTLVLIAILLSRILTFS